MVVNGACKEKDLKHMESELKTFNSKNKSDVRIEYLPDTRSLVALQGPKAAEALSKLISNPGDLAKLPFMYTQDMKVSGIEAWVSRCGYTGEDGFEISVPANQAVNLAHKLIQNKAVALAGLGVRDSLRLEAGLCLYGHDLNDTISPVEANLNWLIGKRRRTDGGFPGYDKINKQLTNGAKTKRVGFGVKAGGPPAREGVEIVDKKGNKIGTVTSGTFSPIQKRSIGRGYVNTEFSKNGTEVMLKVRGNT